MVVSRSIETWSEVGCANSPCKVTRALNVAALVIMTEAGLYISTEIVPLEVVMVKEYAPWGLSWFWQLKPLPWLSAVLIVNPRLPVSKEHGEGIEALTPPVNIVML